MPAVFVHGVPDTHRVWDPVIARLVRTDVRALSLPGFGCDVPAGFPATKEAYVDWLLAELARIPGPIDLVGHDWGCLLVLRAVSLRPEVVRSWVVGGAPIDREYAWHAVAQIWQTPDEGERFMAAMDGPALREALVGEGVPAEPAAVASAHVDDRMKRSILRLYRSAVRLGEEWEADLARITAPGLLIWGENDPYVETRFGERTAERTGARFLRLEGCGHWWQSQRPDETAAAVQAFWQQLPA